ncbi:unnamed protein product [Ectocarpus sp. 12 AP-2014]
MLFTLSLLRPLIHTFLSTRCGLRAPHSFYSFSYWYTTITHLTDGGLVACDQSCLTLLGADIETQHQKPSRRTHYSSTYQLPGSFLPWNEPALLFAQRKTPKQEACVPSACTQEPER